MSSFLKKLINPKTGKEQIAYCIDDYFGAHKYGYGFLKNGKDADWSHYELRDIDFYRGEEINK